MYDAENVEFKFSRLRRHLNRSLKRELTNTERQAVINTSSENSTK